jgi:hypothetical protein
MAERPSLSATVWSSTGTRRSRATPLPTRNAFTVSVCPVIDNPDSADLSLEFLMGRALDNAMLNVGQKDAATS